MIGCELSFESVCAWSFKSVCVVFESVLLCWKVYVDHFQRRVCGSKVCVCFNGCEECAKTDHVLFCIGIAKDNQLSSVLWLIGGESCSAPLFELITAKTWSFSGLTQTHITQTFSHKHTIVGGTAACKLRQIQKI